MKHKHIASTQQARSKHAASRQQECSKHAASTQHAPRFPRCMSLARPAVYPAVAEFFHYTLLDTLSLRQEEFLSAAFMLSDLLRPERMMLPYIEW